MAHVLANQIARKSARISCNVSIYVLVSLQADHITGQLFLLLTGCYAREEKNEAHSHVAQVKLVRLVVVRSQSSVSQKSTAQPLQLTKSF